MTDNTRPTHRHGVPNPDVLGFVSVRMAVAHRGDFAEANEAVARRLGRDVAFVDANGYDDEIVAAAVREDGRFAWLACRSKQVDRGDVDIEFRLHARDGDRTLIDWVPKTYNPFFGVKPSVLAWSGDELEFVYTEKHHTYRAVFGADGGTPRLERETDDAGDRRRGDAERRKLLIIKLMAVTAFVLFTILMISKSAKGPSDQSEGFPALSREKR